MEPRQHNPGQITEHLFRETYQEVFSSLVVRFGREHINLVEDALQDTFYKALKSWKHNNYPKNPKGWLFTVSKNSIINNLKRNSKYGPIDTENLEIKDTNIEIKEDDQLKMLLACAKLEINPLAKLIFTLKSICGFGVTEIANSLQLSDEGIYKHLQRAKRKLQGESRTYFQNKLTEQLSNEDVLYIEQIVYFMFNEGYDSLSNSSKKAINKEICFEAVRLVHLLLKFSNQDHIKHLLALFYFHMARFDSRLSNSGEFVSLRTQNRALWDTHLIQIGFTYLVRPSSLSRFYLEALIASIHLKAGSFTDTNWNEILQLYDTLLKLNNTPIIRLNRAICLFELGKHQEATKELQLLKPNLEHSYLYYSMSMAEYLEDKDLDLAKFWYIKSQENTKQKFRKRMIQKKLDKLN